MSFQLFLLLLLFLLLPCPAFFAQVLTRKSRLKLSAFVGFTRPKPLYL